MSERVAMVTGGARGIGAAIAKRLSLDGFAVAVVDLRESDTERTVEAIRLAGGRAIGLDDDVADATAVETAVATAERPPIATDLVESVGDGAVVVGMFVGQHYSSGRTH